MIIFYWFAEAKKPVYFEQILQALIATAVIQIIVSAIERLTYLLGNVYSFGNWNSIAADGWALMIAVVLGLLLARFCNNDTAFGVARFLKLTSKSSQGDVTHIHKALSSHGVILHFKDGRRLMGYLDAYPPDKKSGIYLVSSPTWVTEGIGQECPETHSIMIDGIDIQWIEFLK